MRVSWYFLFFPPFFSFFLVVFCAFCLQDETEHVLQRLEFVDTGDVFRDRSSCMLLYYCITVLLDYCTTRLLYYCAAILL